MRRKIRTRLSPGRRPPPDPGEGAMLRAMAALAGAVLAFSPFLPWYATDLGAVFTDGSASGWASTNLAKLVVVLGLAAAASAVLLALDGKDLLDLGPGPAAAAAIVTPVAALLALVLIGFRSLFLPGPDEFLTLDWGIYVAAAAGVVTLISGYVLLAR